ncbi:molybdopterin-dependent oxidoreductase [Cereibacter sediminicola]|uniref:molybdopterin-dependent oxidoreductase n=1 Tax=Cereibacter sediminicola TaxID=2584941 RepID=UPI001FE8A473|nr:molybdopterin-dependent oxidoreductase [Cereibacter sediminicola]
MIGANSLETQTNLFLNHMVPGMRGETMAKKQADLPDEPHSAARIVIVDARRTVTVNACEEAAGAENVLHLQIQSGTDLALLNTIFTHFANQGWVDQAFIEASTFRDAVAQPEDPAHPAALGSFEAAREACRMSLAQGAAICGVPEADIAKAAEWIARPKEGGARRRTVTCYEKGIIWGNDNCRTIGAAVNIAFTSGNVGRPGGGVARPADTSSTTAGRTSTGTTGSSTRKTTLSSTASRSSRSTPTTWSIWA